MLIYNIHSTTLTKIHPTVKNVCKPYQNCLRNDIRNDIYTDTKHTFGDHCIRCPWGYSKGERASKDILNCRK